MKSYFEQLLKEYSDEVEEPDFEDIFHDKVVDLLDLLVDNIEILSDEISELVFELIDMTDEIDYEDDFDDEGNSYEEMTSADSVGEYKPKLKKKKEDEDIDEAVAKKVKRDKAARIQRRRDYRKNRAKLKVSGKRMRRTSKYKKYLKKKSKLAKRGLTTTKKRIKKFI